MQIEADQLQHLSSILYKLLIKILERTEYEGLKKMILIVKLIYVVYKYNLKKLLEKISQKILRVG